MAQLRHDYEQFQALNTEVVVIVPNGARMIEWYVNANAIPYPILTDQGSQVAREYAINLRNALVLTAMKPTVFLVNGSGENPVQQLLEDHTSRNRITANRWRC